MSRFTPFANDLTDLLKKHGLLRDPIAEDLIRVCSQHCMLFDTRSATTGPKHSRGDTAENRNDGRRKRLSARRLRAALLQQAIEESERLRPRTPDMDEVARVAYRVLSDFDLGELMPATIESLFQLFKKTKDSEKSRVEKEINDIIHESTGEFEDIRRMVPAYVEDEMGPCRYGNSAGSPCYDPDA